MRSFYHIIPEKNDNSSVWQTDR